LDVANLIDSLALVGLVLYCISFILGRVIEAKIVRRSTDIDAFDGLPMLPSEAGIVKARTCSTCGVPMGEGASPSHRVCSMCYALESIKESSLLGAVMAPLAVGMWIIGFAPVRLENRIPLEAERQFAYNFYEFDTTRCLV
jgi:hypothetical protein